MALKKLPEGFMSPATISDLYVLKIIYHTTKGRQRRSLAAVERR
jgi:hypothetical protein